MPVPTQLPTTHHDGQGPNLLYHVEGELVPVLRLQLGGSIPAYFEHHVLLWKEPTVDIQLKPMKGAFKRFIAGMPIFLTQAVGQGQVGVTPCSGPGRLGLQSMYVNTGDGGTGGNAGAGVAGGIAGAVIKGLSG